MTYRAGNHHGVTIVNEADTTPCGRPGHDCARGHLVAVIVNGDWDLAERIAALLNDGCTGGAAAALALVAERIADHTATTHGDFITLRALRLILEATAAELGVDETAPGSPLSEPVAAETGSGVHRVGVDDQSGAQAIPPCECSRFFLVIVRGAGPGAWCECGHERADHHDGHGPCTREAVMLG